MVTTVRNSSETNGNYAPTRGGVDVLERTPVYNQTSASTNGVELTRNDSETRVNLDRILNYDRCDLAQEKARALTETAFDSSSLSDEDIRPTSTTMQFGSDTEIHKEINKQSNAEHAYHLNKGGKIVVSLYALVVAVVLALIVLNTGVLARLSTTVEAKAEQLNATIARYNALCDELNEMTDSNRILDVAQNEYGMVQK